MGLSPDVEPLPHQALGPRQLQNGSNEAARRRLSGEASNKVQRIAGVQELHLAHLAAAAAAAAIPHCPPCSGRHSSTHAGRPGVRRWLLTCPLSMQAGGGWAGPGEANKGRSQGCGRDKQGTVCLSVHRDCDVMGKREAARGILLVLGRQRKARDFVRAMGERRDRERERRRRRKGGRGQASFRFRFTPAGRSWNGWPVKQREKGGAPSKWQHSCCLLLLGG